MQTFGLTALLCLVGTNAFMTAPGRRASTRLFGEKEVAFDKLDGSDVRVGIIRTRWNDEIVGSLTQGVKDSLKEVGVQDKNIFETTVPGAFELPLASRYLALTNTVDGIVDIGCLIKGETMHFEYIAEAASSGLMRVGLDTGVPCIFGVLTTLTKEQAEKRAIGEGNEGLIWGKSAVEMAMLRAEAMGPRAMRKDKALGFTKAESVNGDKSGPAKSPKRGIGF